MKEISELGVASGESAFLKANAALADSTPLATFASNSGAMVAGYVGTIVGIDYQEVQGARVPVLDQDQIIRIGTEDYRLAKAGERPKAPVITFDNGNRNMTLGLLQQGQKKTTIKYLNGVTKDSTELTLGDIKALVGKKLRCTSFFRDLANVIVRPAQGNQPERTNAANCYTFEEVA